MQEDEPGLVREARAGDHDALRELLARYVPLVYNLAGRAVSHPAAVDEVTQRVLLEVARDLPGPGEFRARLVEITAQHIDDHFRRPAGGAPRDDENGLDFEELAVLWLDLRGQHRDLVRAGHWVDPEHRALLALWWEECAGRITRREIATALELGEAGTAMRLQRMREQLEQCRLAVAALDRRPPCAGLSAVVGGSVGSNGRDGSSGWDGSNGRDGSNGWDGEPTPLWRQRITEHVRTCVVCLRESGDQLPAPRLISGMQLLPLPTALIAALSAQGLLTAEQWEETEPTSPESTPTTDEPARSTWHTVRWAGRVATVTTAATLMLFAGGFVYDVSQTPQIRHERDTSALSASLASPAPSESSPGTSETGPAPSETSPGTSDISPATSTTPPEATGPAASTDASSSPDCTGNPGYEARPGGIVFATANCLVWQRATAANAYSFAHAQIYCAGLDLGDRTWRVPTREEAVTLIGTGAIDTAAFPDTPAGSFWTSTAHGSKQAHAVDLSAGREESPADRNSRFAVRCVSGRAT
ncbi:Lcl domain-containing protein [Kineosporia succinea]|uniref:DNA-directed RNA polymerase specialized sigma24 family protein n=1 Tax=Kineosporia succinea TaxID=84632 RepID=A0ABT9NZ47_9ACTN|nr:DUF1566 domain-containing protein [Kineosporia succinea]MDP9825702.1 DNA-directed RNA polymerase specialized sigma24 family protein [Kineosporia succinea]